MIRLVKNSFHDLLHLIYPEVCQGCKTSLFENEKLLCFTCKSQLPIAYQHLDADDKVKELFYGRTEIAHARSLFFYEKIGIVQQLTHALKYQGQEQISNYLGKMMSEYMKSDAEFQKVTHVVPVPVHPKRLKKRGYNQVDGFGKEIAKSLNAQYLPDLLVKTKNTINQAKLGQVKRSDETKSIYNLNEPERIPEDTHLLIVDDVITTGTTLSLCTRELQKIQSVKLYVATMSISV